MGQNPRVMPLMGDVLASILGLVSHGAIAVNEMGKLRFPSTYLKHNQKSDGHILPERVRVIRAENCLLNGSNGLCVKGFGALGVGKKEAGKGIDGEQHRG